MEGRDKLEAGNLYFYLASGMYCRQSTHRDFVVSKSKFLNLCPTRAKYLRRTNAMSPPIKKNGAIPNSIVCMESHKMIIEPMTANWGDQGIPHT